MGTTQGKIYIVGLSSLTQLEAQYVPQEIAGTRTPKLAEIGVAGRNTPHYQFTGGSEEITIKLDFTAEADSRQDVLEKISRLRAFTYADGRNKPPEYVKIIWGDIFKDERWVIKNVRYVYSLFNPKFAFAPDMGVVDITFAYAPENNPTLNQILR